MGIDALRRDTGNRRPARNRNVLPTKRLTFQAAYKTTLVSTAPLVDVRSFVADDGSDVVRGPPAVGRSSNFKRVLSRWNRPKSFSPSQRIARRSPWPGKLLADARQARPGRVQRKLRVLRPRVPRIERRRASEQSGKTAAAEGGRTTARAKPRADDMGFMEWTLIAISFSVLACECNNVDTFRRGVLYDALFSTYRLELLVRALSLLRRNRTHADMRTSGRVRRQCRNVNAQLFPDVLTRFVRTRFSELAKKKKTICKSACCLLSRHTHAGTYKVPAGVRPPRRRMMIRCRVRDFFQRQDQFVRDACLLGAIGDWK